MEELTFNQTSELEEDIDLTDSNEDVFDNENDSETNGVFEMMDMYSDEDWN